MCGQTMRDAQDTPLTRGACPVGRTLSAALKGEVAQRPQYAEKGHGGEYRDVAGNGKRPNRLLLE